MVIGYEVSDNDSQETWNYLIGRLKYRGIKTTSFMSNGNKYIENSIKEFYPESSHHISYLKAYREKELNCCLARLPIKTKLVNDAVNLYNFLDNQSLDSFLQTKHETNIKQILTSNCNDFLTCVEKNCGNNTQVRIDNLNEQFKERFEKFHMLKGNPIPLINGWLALKMIEPLEMGYNRVSLYLQLPTESSFDMFSNNIPPKIINEHIESERLKSFVLEFGARVLQLPISTFNCELKIELCSFYNS